MGVGFSFRKCRICMATAEDMRTMVMISQLMCMYPTGFNYTFAQTSMHVYVCANMNQYVCPSMKQYVCEIKARNCWCMLCLKKYNKGETTKLELVRPNSYLLLITDDLIIQVIIINNHLIIL